jgi:DNA-binding transcriptional MerR regulator/methylmalonyl-CoA mutase cobalamin-binding subunit
MEQHGSSPALTPRHPIQIVARRTGLSQDVIRAWERRHQAVSPERSASSRRLYSDRDIDRLVLLQRAITAGRRIGDVARLSLEDLSELVVRDESATTASGRASLRPSTGYVMELFEDCVQAVTAINPTSLYTALSTAAASLSTPYLMEDLIHPLLNHIYDECRSGNMRRCQEHMAAITIRSFLIAHIANASKTPASLKVLAATPISQNQEWAALMMAAAAGADSCDAIYLGAEVAADELAFAASQTGAQAILLGISHPSEDPYLPNELRKLRKLLGETVRLIVSGPAAASYQETLKEISAERLQSLGELRLELERLR